MSFPPLTQEEEGISAEEKKKKATTCICADLLIPGRGEPLKNAATVLEDGKIAFVGAESDIPSRYATVPRVRVPVLMPGMWDCHIHFMGEAEDLSFSLPHPATSGALITRSLHDTLMAGITSVREVAGYAIEASKVVEAGLAYGPNVYGAGACLSQTAGHGDQFEFPIGWVANSFGVRSGNGGDYPGGSTGCLADGVDECRRAVRLQIRRGAKLIKVLASGGVLSRDDDPQFQQFSDEELKVIVEEAGRMNRIVAAHVHGKAGIMAAIRAGCKTLEHGSYLDDEAIELMKEKGVMLVATRLIVAVGNENLDWIPNEQSRAKMIQINKIHKAAYAKAVKAGVKCALGTDLGFGRPGSPLAHGKNAGEFAYAVEAGMSPLEAIEAGTANAPDTLGPMAPKSGQIKESYDGDVIALSKNPLDDITVLKDPRNVTHVWKAGKLSKGIV